MGARKDIARRQVAQSSPKQNQWHPPEGGRYEGKSRYITAETQRAQRNIIRGDAHDRWIGSITPRMCAGHGMPCPYGNYLGRGSMPKGSSGATDARC